MIDTSQIPSIIKLSILTQVPVLLLGPHGVGKSTSIKLALLDTSSDENTNIEDETLKLLYSMMEQKKHVPIISDMTYSLLEKIHDNIRRDKNPILKEFTLEIENALRSREYESPFAKVNLSAYELLADILYPVVLENDRGPVKHQYIHVPLNKLYSKIVFLDEINRANRMILRAMLEVILSKEIGTEKMHWLTTVAAGNPASEEYDVEALDPALLDRFSVQYVKRNSRFILMHGHPKITPALNETDFSMEEYDIKSKNKSERSYAFVSRIYFVEDILGQEIYNYIPDYDDIKPKFIEGILGEPMIESKYDKSFFISANPSQELENDASAKVLNFVKYISILPEDVVQKWIEAILNNWTASILTSDEIFRKVKPYLSDDQIKRLINRILELKQELKQDEQKSKSENDQNKNDKDDDNDDPLLQV